jgi:Cft2 family RNA processing exonuclease
MALLEAASKTILYTGDFRLNGADIAAHPLLAAKHVDHLFIDTTFCLSRAARFPNRVCA